MRFQRVFLAICIFVPAGAFPAVSGAADISTLQTALSLARDSADREKARLDASRQAIAQQQQIVAARKKDLANETARLEKLQNDSKQEERQYREAMDKYNKAQSSLDAAWGK